MSIINPEFKYSYSYENAKQLLEDDDVMDFICYINDLHLLATYYKHDRKSYDLACEIAECVGFCNFLKRKHTYEELDKYYKDNCYEKIYNSQENVKKPLLEGTIQCNFIITRKEIEDCCNDIRRYNNAEFCLIPNEDPVLCKEHV